jgi:hypothetical protein
MIDPRKNLEDNDPISTTSRVPVTFSSICSLSARNFDRNVARILGHFLTRIRASGHLLLTSLFASLYINHGSPLQPVTRSSQW